MELEHSRRCAAELERRIRRHGGHLGEQAGAQPDRLRAQQPAQGRAGVRRVQQHAGVAGALLVFVDAQPGGEGEAVAQVVVELAEERGAFLLGAAGGIVGVHEEAGIERRRKDRRRRHGRQVQRVGEHVVAAVVRAREPARADEEVEGAVEAGVQLGLDSPELVVRVLLVVREDAVLMHRQDAAAGHASRAVEQVARRRRPLLAGAAGRLRHGPGAAGVARGGGQGRADVHHVVLPRQVLARSPRADDAESQLVEVVVEAEGPDRLVVLEDRLEIRVHLPKTVDGRALIVVERRIAAVGAERQRASQGGEDAGGGRAEVRRVAAERVRQTAGCRQRIARAHLVGDAHPVVVFLEGTEQQPGVRVVVDLPCEGRPQRLHVAAVYVVVNAGQRAAKAIGLAMGQVLDVAVAVEGEARQAHRHALAEGQIHGAFQTLVPVVAVFDVQEAARLAQFRPLGDEVDGAAGGVAPEQRALGPAQYLHALHVEELDGVQVRRHGDFVQVQGHAGLAGAPDHQIADAADAEARTAEVGGGERHVRRVELQVRRVDDLAVLERLAAHGGDGDRHVLNALGHALRRDHELFDGTGLFLRGCRGRRNKQACEGDHVGDLHRACLVGVT